MVERAPGSAPHRRRIHCIGLGSRSRVWLLAVLSGWTALFAGCASNTVMRSLEGSDRLESITCAWTEPGGRIEVFFSAALAGAYYATDYRLTLERSELEALSPGLPTTSTGPAARIALPRNRLHHRRSSIGRALGKERVVTMILVQDDEEVVQEDSGPAEDRLWMSYHSPREHTHGPSYFSEGQPAAVRFTLHWRDAAAGQLRSVLLELEPDTSSQTLAWATAPILLPTAFLLDACLCCIGVIGPLMGGG